MMHRLKLLFKYLGEYDDDIDFTYGSDTSLEYACGTTFHGNFWIFGGDYEYGNQVPTFIYPRIYFTHKFFPRNLSI